MNVASLELCKELYELSGWDNTYFNYAEHELDGNIVLPYHRDSENSSKWFECPAYTLGYLLRKMSLGFRDLSYHSDGRWIARSGAGTGRFMKSAKTPEDAAAKLAIELWKRGLVERESEEV